MNVGVSNNGAVYMLSTHMQFLTPSFRMMGTRKRKKKGESMITVTYSRHKYCLFCSKDFDFGYLSGTCKLKF